MPPCRRRDSVTCNRHARLERHRRYRETRHGAFDRRSREFCGIPIARAFSWHTLLKDDVDTTNDSRQINGTVVTATTWQRAIESARTVKDVRRAVSSLQVQG